MKLISLPSFVLCCVLPVFSMPLFAQAVTDLKLKDYRPVSIYKVPVTNTMRAKFPVIDIHSHDYAETPKQLDEWVKRMDDANISKTLVLTYATGKSFDSLVARYARYKDRFELWCGFDYTGYEKPGWEKHAVAELERCYKMGARGVGELGDKGLGELYSQPTAGYGLHIDAPSMKPLLQKCGELKIPVSIHVAEDQWMYEKADSTNDGLMNAYKWKVDMSKPGILGHDALIQTLVNAVRDNPGTTFIACHLANSNANLTVLGNLFDKYPNLYADIAARFAEFSPIPRFSKAFFEKYSTRLIYGTDMTPTSDMYRTTFRILESADDHFYEPTMRKYHWPLYGLSLNDETLKRIYSENAVRIRGIQQSAVSNQ